MVISYWSSYGSVDLSITCVDKITLPVMLSWSLYWFLNLLVTCGGRVAGRDNFILFFLVPLYPLFPLASTLSFPFLVPVYPFFHSRSPYPFSLCSPYPFFFLLHFTPFYTRFHFILLTCFDLCKLQNRN